MANDGNGTTWTTATPVLGSDRRDGAQEIRGLRAGIAIRMNKEHIDMSGGTHPADGGEHVAGSAVAFLLADPGTNQLTRPDGETLSSQDDGRLAVDTDDYTLKVYDDSESPSWVSVLPFNAQIQSTEIADSISDGVGWTNNTGSLVLVTFQFRKDSAGTEILQVQENDSSTYRTVTASIGVGNTRMWVGAIFVPSTKILRFDNAVTIAGEAHYQVMG